MSDYAEFIPQAPETQSVKRRVPVWLVMTVIGLFVFIVAGVILYVTIGNDGPPAPISRVELMQGYATLAPNDTTATPETMDALAQTTCRGLAQGVTTDQLITTATQQFKANATEVIRLLVSYGCPDRLSAFK